MKEKTNVNVRVDKELYTAFIAYRTRDRLNKVTGFEEALRLYIEESKKKKGGL